MTLLEYVKGKIVLTFGDSLTHGMIVTPDSWTNTHPYSLKLSQLINDSKTEVLERGISGELVTHMVERLPKELTAISSRKKNSSSTTSSSNVALVIILGGTNDLGHRHRTEKILEEIKILHKVSQRYEKENDIDNDKDPNAIKKVYTIAITIPQLNWDIQQESRIKVNAGIREFVKENNETTFLLDFENLFDQKVSSNLKYWSSDTVHFSSEGYDKIGEIIYEMLSTTIIH